MERRLLLTGAKPVQQLSLRLVAAYVEIDKDVTDSWGIPVLRFNCRMSDNEREMAKDAIQNLRALMEALGAETPETSLASLSLSNASCGQLSEIPLVICIVSRVIFF